MIAKFIPFVIVYLIIVTVAVIKGRLNKIKLPSKKEIYDLDMLIEEVKKTFTEILRADVTTLNLNKVAVEQARRNKNNLRINYKNCSLGDLGAKEFVKEYIKDMLEKRFGINNENITKYIPFNEPRLLTAQDKGEILLLHYKKQHGFDAFSTMVDENDMVENDSEKGYIITSEKIGEVYDRLIGHSFTSYPDRMEVLAQRIYQKIKGNSVTDEIRDQRIDGISGGVSGIPAGFFNYDTLDEEFDAIKKMQYSYESVWVMLHGKSVRLEYLSFGTQRELERVVKNIYRYDNPGQLSKSKPYIVNKMADGSRVVVVRPDFADSWAFFVRKFDTASAEDIHVLLNKSRGAENIIAALKYIIIGEQTTFITGMQGTGKTTILKAICNFIRRSYNIRVQEMTFELWLRKVFPYMNVLAFQEGVVSGQDGLNLQKKTDGDVNILGEVAAEEQFAWAIQTSGTASRFTLATQHSRTTRILVNSATSALMRCYGYTSEMFARDRVIQAVRFDLHLEKNLEGERYIERLTEIIPGENMGEYTIKNIIEYHDGEYVLVNPISDETVKEMMMHMTAQEKEDFKLFEETAKLKGCA